MQPSTSIQFFLIYPVLDKRNNNNYFYLECTRNRRRKGARTGLMERKREVERKGRKMGRKE